MERRVRRSLSIARVDEIKFMESIVGVKLMVEKKETEIAERMLYGETNEVERVNNKSFNFSVMFSSYINNYKIYNTNDIKIVLNEIIDNLLTVVSKEVLNAVNEKIKIEQFGIEISFISLTNIVSVRKEEAVLKSVLKEDETNHIETDGIVLHREGEPLSFTMLKDLENNFAGNMDFILNTILQEIGF